MRDVLTEPRRVPQMNDITALMQARIREWIDGVTPPVVRDLVDDGIRTYFGDVVERVHADEGSIWIRPVGEERLVVAYNSGSRTALIEGRVTVPLAEGLVGKCFRERSVVCPRGLFRDAAQSSRVDAALDQVTFHQVAAPLTVFGTCCGVLSAVQLGAGSVTPRDTWGFDDEDIRTFTICADVTARLLEHRWLTALGASP